MVDSPYGVPYPGKWAFWRGEWYEARTYSDEEKLILLSHEGPVAPGEGWDVDKSRNSSAKRGYSRIVPFGELEIYEEFKVNAQWRGYGFSIMRIGSDGLATGWAGELSGRSYAGGELAAELERSGYWHGQVERSTVEAIVPVAELTDFRLVRHRDLGEVLRKAGW